MRKLAYPHCDGGNAFCGLCLEGPGGDLDQCGHHRRQSSYLLTDREHCLLLLGSLLSPRHATGFVGRGGLCWCALC